MGNEVSTSVFGGSIKIANTAALAEKAAAAAQNNPRGGAPNGSDYMNFSGKRGIYTIGTENRQIASDELWVVDVTSFEEGWICWKGGKPVSTRLANIYTGVPVQTPDPNEHGPFNSGNGEGWFQAKSMVMKSLDNGQQGYLKLNSVSGVSAMAEQLIAPFAERAAAGEAAWPVIGLETEEFTSQGYKNFKPNFVVYGWLTDEQLQAVADGQDVADFIDQPEPEPKVPVRPAVTGGRRRP